MCLLIAVYLQIKWICAEATIYSLTENGCVRERVCVCHCVFLVSLHIIFIYFVGAITDDGGWIKRNANVRVYAVCVCVCSRAKLKLWISVGVALHI